MTLVVTWNIQWGLGIDGRVDLDRIAQVIGTMGDPDILCLQEVARRMPSIDGAGADQVAELAALFPGHAAVFGPAVERAGPGGNGAPREEFGNLILSRLPILQVFRHPLPQPPDPAVKHMPRQATEAVIAAPWGPLRITTTHLEYHSETQRLGQAAHLRALHAEAAANQRTPGVRPDDGGPYASPPRPASGLICGDLNLVADDIVYRAFTFPFAEETPPLIDAWRHLHPNREHAATCGIFDHAQWPQGPHCRDFFFVTPDLAARVVAIAVDQETDASDHQPVSLTLAD